MAAHRYWRVNITAIEVPAESKVTLHDVEFKTTAGGADVTGSGTASANASDAGTSAAACFDNVGNNLWSTGTLSPGAWIKYDFGAGNDKDIVEVTLTTGVSYGRSPKDFTVDYSDDNVSWTTAMTLTGITGWLVGQRRVFQASGEQPKPADYGACRHWRIAVTAVEDLSATGTEQPQISEMEYRITLGGADQTGSGTATSGSVFAGGGAANAFDNNNATQWSANGGLPWWFLAYDFGAGNNKDVLEVSIRNTSAHSEDGPKDFVIQRSADGLAWTTALNIVGSTGWSAGETRVYNWSNNSPPPPAASARPVVFVAT